MPDDAPITPMTIASARAFGLSGVEVVCKSCRRSAPLAFGDLGLADATPIPAVAKSRRFVCSGCGSRSVVSLPDWSGYVAPGMGGM